MAGVFQYVENESDLPSELICTVCHDVAGTHAACPGCRNTFCQNCVHKWFNTLKSGGQGCTCPYCRRKLKFSDLQHDPAIQQQLDALLVHCPNQPAGCAAAIPRASVPGHLRRECSAQPSSCKFCGVEGTRADISQHEAHTCPHRLVPCSNAAAGCSTMVPLRFLQSHLDHVCDYQQRPCPKCKQPVSRYDWSNHLQENCPASQFCPLRLYGCSFTGTAEHMQQHQQHCPYQQHRQQLEKQLAAGAGAGAATAAAAKAQASLACAEPGELPTGCVVDQYRAFSAPSISRSAALASQLLLAAVPAEAIPAKLPQEPDWLVNRAAAVEAATSPATLAVHTGPKQIAAGAGDSSSSSSSSTGSSAATAGGGGSLVLPHGMTPVEALALGIPHCFSVLGLETTPCLGVAWRVLLNLSLHDVLSSEGEELPSSFMLYSSLLRAWNTASSILGKEQQQHHQQQQDQQPTGSGGDGSSESNRRMQQQGSSSNGSGGGSNSSGGGSNSSGGGGNSSNSEAGTEEEQALPGLQRALYDDEFEELDGWVLQQRQLLSAVGSLAARVLQLWLGLACAASLLPGQAGQLAELQRAAEMSLQVLAEVVSSKKTSRRSSAAAAGGGNARQEAAEGAAAAAQQQQGQQQQQQGQQGWLSSRFAWLSSVMPEQQRRQQPAAVAAREALARIQQQATAAGNFVPPRGLGPGLGRQRTQQQQQQQQQQQDAALSDVAGASAAPAAELGADEAVAASLAVAMGQLQQLSIGPPVPKKRRVPEFLQGRPPLEALELATAVLVLHHLRASHVETSMIPVVTNELLPGYRAFWGPSVLAGAQVWLGPGFRLGWQAVAVLSDMVMGVAQRLMQIMGEGFYDAQEARVPMTPHLALAAVQLLLPPGLLHGCTSRLAALSAAYHDEECDELAEVTWQQLAQRIGLTIELDKLVFLVDTRLPVSAMDDEDEDEDDEDMSSGEYETEEEGGQNGSENGSGSSSDEYTTDDEYMQEQEHEQEQQQALMGDGIGAAVRRYLTMSSPAAARGGSNSSSRPNLTAMQAAVANNAMQEMERMVSSSRAGSSPASRTPGGGSSSGRGTWASSSSSRAAPRRSSAVPPSNSDAAAAADAAALSHADLSNSSDDGHSDEDTDGEWESADGTDDEIMTAALDNILQQQQQQQQQQQTEAAAAAPASTSQARASVVQVAATAADQAGSSNGTSAAPAQQQPQQQHQQQPETGSAGVPWEQQLAANLQQLADRQSDLSDLEQQLLQQAVQSITWTGTEVARAWGLEEEQAAAGQVSGQQGTTAAAAAAGSSHIPGQSGQARQQQQQQQQRPEPSSAPAPAAAAAVYGPQPHQRREGDGNSDGGDTTTHGVVLLAGVLECVMKLLLEGAGKAAAEEAAMLAAVGTGTASAERAAVPADGQLDAAAAAAAASKQQLHEVFVTARHVLLAAGSNDDLRTLLLDRPINQQAAAPAAVSWAGVLPDLHPGLLPHPQQEPISAWLLQLAAGKWQQQQQQQQPTDSGDSSNSNSAVLFPVDLRFYCGRTWPQQGNGVEALARASAPAAAAAAAAASEPVACCFLSGWQCSSCAAATTGLHAADIDTQLDVCKTRLAGVQVGLAGVGRSSSSSGIDAATSGRLKLTDEQQHQLMAATRLYHLQQQWLYDDPATGGAAAGGSEVHSSATTSSSSRLSGWRSLPAVDQVQLANVQLLLQPLKDVAALREVQLQQQQGGNVWPEADFQAMVQAALENVAAEKRQQSKLQRQLQQLIVEPATAGTAGVPSLAMLTAAAAGGARTAAAGSSSASNSATATAAQTSASASAAAGYDAAMEDESSSDDAMDIDDEALDLLAAAAEDFLAEQFRGANTFALHAGRQEVGPEDLRVALMSSGYGHMLPTGPAIVGLGGTRPLHKP